MPNPDSTLLTSIRTMDQEMEHLIGRTVFGYVANPTPTSVRVTFGDGHVCLSVAEAKDYMTDLLATARDNPAKLPWPLCEPMPS